MKLTTRWPRPGERKESMTEESRSLEVSRRIGAPAERLFRILSNPQRHEELDGSDMLRGTDADRPLSGVGDTFTMKCTDSETTTS
jgi:uncharacterized protein YndB with AHSA1/START domain